jgi:hypothetical protein
MNEHLTRRNNLLNLYVEFRAAQATANPTEPGRGTDVLFAEKLQIAKTTLSTMKSGSRPIGNKMARQFEALCSKPVGWMDKDHSPLGAVQAGVEIDVFLQLARTKFENATSEERGALMALVSKRSAKA